MSNPFNSPDFGSSGERRPEDSSQTHRQPQQPSYQQQGYQQGFQQPSYQQYPQYQQNAPMQPVGAYGAPVPAGTQKSKVVAAVLAFFLGTLGIHNFYLGYTSRAVCQLVLTIIGYVTAILLIGFLFLFCVGVWAFVEFIMILVGGGRYSHDARGLPLN
ncbi:TM2 domain-containing protein [Corynebacterium sp. USCH3]|uniref:TM2 domain-containing protein n=1 Tax=Corynebacterium sp. USCH3 TaxID=3024840 RepID=UPI0030A5D583